MFAHVSATQCHSVPLNAILKPLEAISDLSYCHING